jgi:hypothetical protein
VKSRNQPTEVISGSRWGNVVPGIVVRPYFLYFLFEYA